MCCMCQYYNFWIECDNINSVAQIHNPILHSRAKYMELAIFFLERVLKESCGPLHSINRFTYKPNLYLLRDSLFSQRALKCLITFHRHKHHELKGMFGCILFYIALLLLLHSTQLGASTISSRSFCFQQLMFGFCDRSFLSNRVSQ